MSRGRDKPRLVEMSSRFALAGLAALAAAMNGAILPVTDVRPDLALSVASSAVLAGAL